MKMEGRCKFKVKDCQTFCLFGMLGCVIEGWLYAVEHFLWSRFRVTRGLGISPPYWAGFSPMNLSPPQLLWGKKTVAESFAQ